MTIEDVLRWSNVILGFASGMAVLWACFCVHRSRGAQLGMVGGAMVNTAVAIGTLGVLFGFESIWRLPLLTAALAYVLVGRSIEIAYIRKHRRDRNDDNRRR